MIKSTIRGLLFTLNLPNLSTLTQTLEMYDGENIYIQGQNPNAFPYNKDFKWSISNLNSEFTLEATSSLLNFSNPSFPTLYPTDLFSG